MSLSLWGRRLLSHCASRRLALAIVATCVCSVVLLVPLTQLRLQDKRNPGWGKLKRSIWREANLAAAAAVVAEPVVGEGRSYLRRSQQVQEPEQEQRAAEQVEKRSSQTGKKLLRSVIAVPAAAAARPACNSVPQITVRDYFTQHPLKTPANSAKTTGSIDASLLAAPPVIVLSPPTMYGSSKDGVHECPPLPVACVWSSDKRLSSSAEVGLYAGGRSPASLPADTARECLPLRTMSHSMEFHHRGALERGHDASSSYRLDSDVYTPYLGEWVLTLNEQVVKNREGPRKDAAVFVARNCHSRNGREQYVRELQEYITVDSVGSCMNNAPWPTAEKHHSGGDWGTHKTDALTLYKLYFAFENINSEDYVTEKIFNGYGSGAIPVYMGASNIEEFVPYRDSVIVASDFASVAELGRYLQRVLTEEPLYRKHTEWRSREMPKWFVDKWSFLKHSPECRTCLFGYAQRHGYGWNKKEQMFESR
eukprot:GHVS01059212.1.p1 GENE.GHVS01059212.1~~GHVS01059212.1.p1  ORF type:complete len:479 (+),score=107.94 GHVS01059212.1:238-1674(+)